MSTGSKLPAPLARMNDIAQDISRATPAEIEPLHDWVLVRKHKRGVTDGGLHVPERAQEKEADGVVIAVGPGRATNTGTLAPMSVKVGDEVMCMPGAENLALPKNPGHMLIRDTDILARRAAPKPVLQ